MLCLDSGKIWSQSLSVIGLTMSHRHRLLACVKRAQSTKEIRFEMSNIWHEIYQTYECNFQNSIDFSNHLRLLTYLIFKYTI